MKTVKIVSFAASTIIFLLIALALNLEDPLKANYRNTIAEMMAMENMKREKEVLSKYPALSEAKGQIAKADQLRIQISSKTSGPANTYKSGNKQNWTDEIESVTIKAKCRTITEKLAIK